VEAQAGLQLIALLATQVAAVLRDRAGTAAQGVALLALFTVVRAAVEMAAVEMLQAMQGLIMVLPAERL
jgi:hypothetical protein